MSASRWLAAGKHPCARDFFRVGEPFPLAVNLARWVEAGYDSRPADSSSIRSWRFWAAAGDILCYGVLVDSRDGLGRSFPLLVAGQNRDRGWQRGWQDIPVALERSWATMEGIVADGCPDLATLETRMFKEGAQARVEPPASAPLAETAMPPLPCVQDAERFSLSCPPGEKIAAEFLAAAHAALKRRVGKAPSSVFMGGLIQAPRIIFFYRPLATPDFTWLWGDDTGAGDGAT